jgi:hypothetical protein
LGNSEELDLLVFNLAHEIVAGARDQLAAPGPSLTV